MAEGAAGIVSVRYRSQRRSKSTAAELRVRRSTAPPSGRRAAGRCRAVPAPRRPRAPDYRSPAGHAPPPCTSRYDDRHHDRRGRQRWPTDRGATAPVATEAGTTGTARRGVGRARTPRSRAPRQRAPAPAAPAVGPTTRPRRTPRRGRCRSGLASLTDRHARRLDAPVSALAFLVGHERVEQVPRKSGQRVSVT